MNEPRTQWWKLGLAFWLLVVGALVWSSWSEAQTHRWAKFAWTNPNEGGQVVGFRMIAYDDLNVLWQPKLYSDTLTSSLPPSWSGKGQPGFAWIRVPISQGRQCMYFLVSIGPNDSTGRPMEAISNPAVIAPAVRDTNYLDQSVMRWARSDADGFVRWKRAPGDSVWTEGRAKMQPGSLCNLVASQTALAFADRVTCWQQFRGWWDGAIWRVTAP